MSAPRSSRWKGVGPRAGATALGIGSAISGLLAYVFFATVTRALGAEAAAPVAVLWTYWSFAAAALTFPLQHWIVRTVTAQAGREGVVRRTLPRMAMSVLVIAAFLSIVTWLVQERLFGDEGAWFPALVGLVTLGSALGGVVRGVLTARGHLAAVGLTLVAENGARCLLAFGLVWVAAASGGSWADGALAFGAALVLGQVVGLAWPRALVLGCEETASEAQPWWRFMGGAGGGQLVSQLVLTGAPVALALRGGTPAEVTGLFAALALFRAPYTLALGAVSPLTGRFTRLVVRGEVMALRRLRIAVLVGGVVVAVVAGLLGLLIGEWVLQLVFGPSVDLATDVSVLTAVGSGLALACLVLSLLAMALDRASLLASTWLAAAGIGLAWVLLAPGAPAQVAAAAFAVAEAVALVLLWLRLRIADDVAVDALAPAPAT